MAHGNPIVRKMALQKIIAVHPELTAEQAIDAVDKLDHAGVLSVNGNGESVLVDLNDQKYAEVLRRAPNLVGISDISSRYPDREKVRLAMQLEAKAGQPPKPELDSVKLAERLKAIPRVHPGASDRAKCERARAVEAAYRESGHRDENINGGG
jgi:hypothetical protein